MNNKSKPGGWKCVYCGKIFRTRKEKQEHVKSIHPQFYKKSWCKGLTAETCSSLREISDKLHAKYLSGELTPNRSPEIGKKISEALKNFYRNNPKKSPFAVCDHKNGQSYAESYFMTWLKNENISFKQEYRESPYSLDFLVSRLYRFRNRRTLS